MLTSTIDELRSIALAAADASGHFPALYARVTREVEISAAGGHFADASRMEVFARAFAGWYPGVRHDGAAMPGCWQAAFEVADDGRLMIVQHLLLGISAHVNHDLPQVVVALAPRGSDLGELRSDFDAVNDILAASLPMVLRSLGAVSRWVNTAAVLGGERLFDFSLKVARRQAWEAAVRMHALNDADRAEYAIELDRLVRVLAYMIVRPGPVSAAGVAIGRRCEERDPREVTRQLLGPLA